MKITIHVPKNKILSSINRVIAEYEDELLDRQKKLSALRESAIKLIASSGEERGLEHEISQLQDDIIDRVAQRELVEAHQSDLIEVTGEL